MTLDATTRAAALDDMTREPVDVLVIGGGIVGAGVARDAALRGLRTGLVEAKDFAAGTSSRSTKLIHSGMRYMAQGDFEIVRESAQEREILRHIAPHLARRCELLIPALSYGEYAKVRVGLWVFDRVARITGTDRHDVLSAEAAGNLEPCLQSEDLTTVGRCFEYITDDARLVIENIRSAAAAGAAIANRAAVVDCLRDDEGQTIGVTVEDALTGERRPVHARVVVNAAGPWVDAVRRLEADDDTRLTLTKGIHVVVPRARLPIHRIIAWAAEDGRGVVAIPRRDVTYIGTTDTAYPDPDHYPTITDDDVKYVLDAASQVFRGAAFRTSDVVGAWAGLRPLLAEEGKAPSEISRKHEVMTGPGGMLSVAGGKLTTYRRIAERVVDAACERLVAQGIAPPTTASRTDELTLPGAISGDIDAYRSGLIAGRPDVPSAAIDRLVGLYGAAAAEILEDFRGGAILDEAEVAWTIDHEMALTLEDVLERRTRAMLWQVDHGLGQAEQVAGWMGARLGWDDSERTRQVEAYRALCASVTPGS